MLLPDGYTSRHLGIDDARAVFEVMAAQERHDLGEVMIEEADIVADWQRPSYDVAAGTVGVFADARVVAYAEHSGGDRGDAAVHPDHRGRGLGTGLARWMQDTARRRGALVVGMPVPQDGPGDRLLEALGYHVRWTSWVLELPARVAVPRRALPASYVVRAAIEAEHPAAYQVNEDAFLEWSDRKRESLEDWRAGSVLRPGFEPWQLRVVTGPGGEVVAMALVVMVDDPTAPSAYVAKLATHPAHRGRGLAQALLVDAFEVAREHGAVRSMLDTDSRTGALGLYERVGMVVTSTWLNRAIAL